MAVLKKWLIIHIILLFCLIPLFGTPIFASEPIVPDKIVKDFQPISGYLIKVVGDDYILDLDSSRGVGIGDLFSVIQRGEKLIHPVTKKVVGTLEETKGILKITRIKTGYSYARLLKKDFDLNVGDVVRRYDNLKAVFWDYTKQGRTFSGRLQSVLPNLKWLDYDLAQQTKPPTPVLPSDKGTSLFFILTHQGFEVRDSQFFLLHTYNLSKSPATTGAGVSTLPGSGSKPLRVPSVIGKKSPGSFLSVAKNIENRATYQDMNTIGELAGKVVMADFNRFGEKVLLAATDGANIGIYKVSQGLTLMTTATTPSPGQILALQWWRPAEKGPLYLSVLNWSDNEALSTIFSLTDGKLIPVQKRIPRIMGAFDLDGDKQPETLLSQEFDEENFFGRRIKELKLIEGNVRYSPAPFGLPDRFTVLGSHFADLTGDAELEAIFIRSGVLHIFSGEKLLYASPKQMGGSLSFLTYDVDPTAKNVMTTSAAFEVSPITMDLNGDGTAELLAVASDKSYLGSFGMAPGIKKSWVAVVKFSNGRFQMGALGQELQSPIQGLAVSNQNVLVVSVEGAAFSVEAGKSYLLAYPVNQ